jgi:Domain of unknown function (DUF4296)
MIKLLPLFLLVLAFSCKQETNPPDKLIEKARMQELLWDLLRADAFITGFAGKGDTAFNQLKESVVLYRQVFAIHKTDKEHFRKSLEWYQQHPGIMKIILDTLQQRQKRVMEGRSKPSGTFPPDSIKSE